jgi:hypothetical protein
VRNEISEADHQGVLRSIRALVDVVPEVPREPRATASPGNEPPEPPSRVLGVSARTATDETLWDMWAQLFDPTRVAVESVGSAYLGAEAAPLAKAEPPDLVAVLSIPPGGLAQARYICRRLRAKLPGTPILVIRPGVQANGKESAQRLTEDGATHISFTLEDAHRAAEQHLVMGRVAAAKRQAPTEPARDSFSRRGLVAWAGPPSSPR